MSTAPRAGRIASIPLAALLVAAPASAQTLALMRRPRVPRRARRQPRAAGAVTSRR